MRIARQRAMLVLLPALLLFPGITEPAADGRTVDQVRVVVQQSKVVYGGEISYASEPYPYGGYDQAPPRNAAPVVIHISPRKASVIVDGTNVGQARDFDSRAYPLWLKVGTHNLELSYKGHQTLRVKFEVKRGRAYRVHYELRDGEGVDPRSAKTAQEPPVEPEAR
jgi:hypothetical protein